ncbi:MAG: tRNA uracil 4-sulfurtransferase ThiI [Halanaerobium sp.]|nr:tRNA uracil 4-sulfurtransferase ThiI [Halanaerobium sp.]
MKEQLYLIKYGEIALKGKNRRFFEDKLLQNIRKRMKREFQGCDVFRTRGRVFARVAGPQREVLNALSQVFGIVGVSPAHRVSLEWEEIKATALELTRDRLAEGEEGTFKVAARRSNKGYFMDSMEINRELGAHLLQNLTGLKVDVHNPDFKVIIEIRANYAYIYLTEKAGVGGMPLGVSGRGILLLSGGIDSPVAGWLAMKRGVEISPLYFHSPPFTTERAKEKVVDLSRVLARYAGPFNLYVAHFTEAQTQLQEKCALPYLTILMRRLMVGVAEGLAREQNALGLFTGESIGQVASQTMESMQATADASNLPIYRPLICYDKREIINLSREIGTYEISIRPYEDCCTVFVPDNPVTRPGLERVREEEEKIDFQALVQDCLDKLEKIAIEPAQG